MKTYKRKNGRSVRKYTLFVFAKPYTFVYNKDNVWHKGDCKMYINERDQINYHGFLKALREMNQVRQEMVSIGICTVSGMNRFENGNRIAEKLMRDRLTARLGISGEKYEDYLQRKEYIRWQHRLRIVKAIEKRELSVAKEELSAYANLRGLNTVNKQFVETMRFMILSLENASPDELLECIRKAVKYTVPNSEKALAGKHLLADQEINLIAEKMRLTPPKAAIRDETAWRISEYEKLIAYMDNSHWEALQKAKVYPKVVYYICQLLLEKEKSEEELRNGLELCDVAIELLRDTCRLYYFVELTGIREILVERLMLCAIDSEEKCFCEKLIKENNLWEKTIKKLYSEYKLDTYMSNFCYLYYETECHDMAEVIEHRRSMFNLSRVKLSEGICDERTIVRFEREGRNPSVETVRVLFEKLGLCAEYRRAQIITTDVDALILYNENLRKAANDANYEIALEYIDRLKRTIDMELSHNRQEIKRIENYMLYKSKKISAEMYGDMIIESLECTINESALMRSKEKFLTRSEYLCIHDLAFDMKTNISETCLEIVEELCNENRIEKKESRSTMREWMVVRWVGLLGDKQRYQESSELSREILKECLVHYRMPNLWDYMYNIIWNYQKENIQPEKLIVDNGLEMCMVLSQIVKKYSVSAFFQEKLKEK